ncbi:PLP-dependent transferase [Cristinia sonorae]|uniref:PLP-dependent transferase n=1 Tax=Cristinia sonorae TaxID=1940300 RepID=A0A8K0XN17_9AGAR|nr:PLP-dependent transferase [Cristinia sonorae]
MNPAMSDKRVEAVDLSHHISNLSKARLPSPLKSLAKYMGKPGLITLAGGMPHPDYFPFADISGNALPQNSYSVDASSRTSSLSWIWNIFGSKPKTIPVTIPKYPTASDQVNLATALQYGQATGLSQLQAFIKDFAAQVYDPAYSNWTCLCHTGNTDGLTRVFLTLLNPGEMFLTEEWTYPSALATAQPVGCKPVPIRMDGEGMRSDDLKKVLSGWDEQARGAKRPHVMYTVPIGQNPSGATMGVSRKQEIYDICVEYDIIIIEDDPYYFLQMKEYRLPSERTTSKTKHDGAAFIASLEPSYLKIDVQGRVIRLDTFSKTIAPGSRLGFFTCNPLFAERLERQGETTTQAPCGFGQSLITQLLVTWGYDGYVRWLHGLAVEYEVRRNFLLDTLASEFHLRPTLGVQGIWKGLEVFVAYAKPDGSEKFGYGNKLFSIVPPTSGMFLWVKLHFDDLHNFQPGDEESLEMQMFIKLAESGVIVAPGWLFAGNPADPPEPGSGHFRIAFSNADPENFKKAVDIFSKVLRDFHKQ